MANHVSARDPTAIVLMVVSSLLLLLVLVFLITRLTNFVASENSAPPTAATAPTPMPANTPGKSPATPGGNDADGGPAIRGGKQIVEAVCINCHGPGVLGAPKLDSHEQWLPRVGQGFDALLRHTADGFRNMPARGGDPSLSDDELKRAIAYMLDQAGIETPKDWETAGASTP